ncbi:MAG: type II toxin-antitoxin system VapC family toxin [Candidatus Anammoxibacter sp.]
MQTTNSSDELILLDTHVWIWLLNGNEKLINPKCLSYIESCVKYSTIRVSVISVWEIGMLESKGRIKFPMDCLDWVNKALQAPGVSLVPITPDIAIESSRLPGKFHGDPADRIIAATARKLRAVLITHDKNIINYGMENYLKIKST